MGEVKVLAVCSVPLLLTRAQRAETMVTLQAEISASVAPSASVKPKETSQDSEGE
jgi:hypothetical protein